jgi:peptidyl-dipeptidase Dcp
MYFDYFKRDNKTGGAWMSNFVNQSKLLGTKPVIYNVANLPKPAPGQPALISFDDAPPCSTNSAMPCTAVRQPDLSPGLGTNVARDFVEFPSQFNEHWALYPKCSNTMPSSQDRRAHPASAGGQDQAARKKWGQGYALGELLAASELDMQWHKLPPARRSRMWTQFEVQALKKPLPISQCADRATAPAISCTSGQWLCQRLLRLSMDGDAG